MAQELRITGMHCGGCVNRVAKALRAIDAGVVVTLEPPRATFTDGAGISLAAVKDALAKIGEYHASETA